MQSQNRAILFLFVLFISCVFLGCIFNSDKENEPVFKMEFQSSSINKSEAKTNSGITFYPPYWKQIHRDTMCVYVEATTDTSDLSLEVVLSNSKDTTQTSVSLGYTTFSNSKNGKTFCRPTGLFSRFRELDSIDQVKFSILGSIGNGNLKISEVVFLINLNRKILDLHPYYLHFFPMETGKIYTYSDSSIYLRNPEKNSQVTSRKKLIDWKISENPNIGSNGCSSDSVAQLFYETDSLVVNEETRCDDLVLTDSADTANRFRREFIFGKDRVVESFSASLTGGNSSGWTRVDGIGALEKWSVNGVFGQKHVLKLVGIE